MAIRLNLLAEAQAAEALRRRDPVKRALVAGVVLVSLMLMWSSSLQVKTMMAKGALMASERSMNQSTNEYHTVLDNQRRIAEARDHLAALQHLAANRFLHATLLNALQQTTVDDVQLLHLHVEQAYAPSEGPKPRAPEDHPTPGPAPAPTVNEHIVLTLDAVDSSPNPGDQINKFREAVAASPYFQERLDKTNAIILKNYSAPQISPTTGKSCVLFTLECRFLDKTR